MDSASAVVEIDGQETAAAPALLVDLSPWHEVFLSNLGDLFARKPVPLRLASKPGDFWPDVFVYRGLPWLKFAESAVCHAAVIAFALATVRYWPKPVQPIAQPVFHESDVIYYDASEFLPPLDTGGARAQLPRKADPVYSPQPIISVPPEADNHTQTIVTPPNVKLEHDVPMPNVVAWSPRQVAVPMAATARSLADTRRADLTMTAIAPAPDLQGPSSRHALTAPQAVVAPAPSLDQAATRRLGDMNIGHSDVVAPAPSLPVAEQRTLASARVGLGSGASVVPPPPSGWQGSGGGSGDGRIIALGIHPAAGRAPIEPPAGNRRGSFAATPQGKPGASGAPEVNGSPANGPGAGSGSANRNGIPPGLHVGEAPKDASPSTGGVNGQNSGGGTDGALMAKATPPRVGTLPQRTAPELPSTRTSDVEKEVFGARKVYSMSINMPNLNSAGGSWVIHFAELNDNDQKGDLSTPTAIAISDPGYPLELMRQNIQGVVTLYAVIHADGSVGDVKVMQSVDDRLDEYARSALARWRFRPATKNGSAVDLAAVITIPFKPGRIRPAF